MKLLQYIFLFLIFPGFLFSGAMGLFAQWIDRKVTARIQWRVGPPWYQNFLDVAKLLFYKETLIPEGVSKGIFLGMPVLSMTAATLVSTIVLVVNGVPQKSFVGDVIVIVYLMMIPAIALMLGAFSSRNSLASLGASREMKLMLSYELPFILALAVPIIKSGYAVRLGSIISAQQGTGAPFINSISGMIACAVMLLCLHAKLGFVPFDMPEAETEIMAGTYIEYSGKALGFFKLGKAIMTFLVPVFLITLFFGGIKFTIAGFIANIAEYVAILSIMIVIKNTNPRVRIDHAVKFFWSIVTSSAVIAVLLAYLGR